MANRIGGPVVTFPEQVHGAGVRVIAERRGDPSQIMAGGEPGADALVTALPDVPIGVLVADCMPVLLADPVAQVAGVAHAGRRGLAAGVLQATLDAMTGLGAKRPRIRAVVGPAICGRCYEVPARMRDEVDTAVPGTACVTAAGTPGLDLVAGALGLLHRAGVEACATGICTAEDDRLYSYRRDGLTGRFAGVVMLSPDG